MNDVVVTTCVNGSVKSGLFAIWIRYDDAPVTAPHENAGLVDELMNPLTGALKVGATVGAAVSTTKVRTALHALASP